MLDFSTQLGRRHIPRECLQRDVQFEHRHEISQNGLTLKMGLLSLIQQIQTL
jgi:hypothetical protein